MQLRNMVAICSVSSVVLGAGMLVPKFLARPGRCCFPKAKLSSAAQIHFW